MSDVRAAETAAARSQQPSVHIGRRMARQQRSNGQRQRPRRESRRPGPCRPRCDGVACSTSRRRSTSGCKHPSGRLPAWRSLTTGVPAALSPAAGTRRLKRAPPPSMAASGRRWLRRRSTSCGTSSGSWLRRPWRCTSTPARTRRCAGAPSGPRAPACRCGVPAPRGGHAGTTRGGGGARAAPVVVCDGLCARCGRCAPLAGFLGVVAPRGGSIVIDDTQAVGLLGERPAAAPPYGSGGGGTPRHIGLSDPRVLAVVSFAKALGAPVAALLGSDAAVAAYERKSGCREHSSPPSAVVAPSAGRGSGERERGRRPAGATRGADRALPDGRAERAASRPAGASSRYSRERPRASPRPSCTGRCSTPASETVLRAGHSGPELCFVVTARHAAHDVDRAVEALAASTREHRSRFTSSRS